MIQLAFEPAFDPFHAAFRFVCQAVFRRSDIAVARAKLLDFFVVQPRRCADIRVPPALRGAAKKAASCQTPTYGRRPSAFNLFNRMGPMQDAAIQTLVLQGILDADAFMSGYISLSDNPLAQRLSERVSEFNDKNQDLFDFLINKLEKIPFEGVNGLKHRTGLGEYRYDIV